MHEGGGAVPTASSKSSTHRSCRKARAQSSTLWSLFEQRPDRQALNWKLRVRLKRAVELDFGALETLRVAQSDYRGREYSRTQEISDVVNYLGYDGLIVPCARYECRNLIIYIQNLAGDCMVEEIESKVFEWSTWSDGENAEATSC